MKRLLILALLFMGASTRAADLSIGLAADVSSLDPRYLNIASNSAIGAESRIS